MADESQRDLFSVIRGDKQKRARARKEAIRANRSRIVGMNDGGTDTVVIESRDDAADEIEIKPWSPELNKEFLELPRLVGDRDPTVKRINGLKLKIAACRLPFFWAVAFDGATGGTYRINGNTTANIAMAYPELFDGATVVWCVYYCETMDEIQLLYSQFDSRLSTRTISSALLPYIVGFGVAMSPTLVSPVLSGINLVLNSTENYEDTIEDRIMTLHDALPFVHWMEDNIVATREGPNRPFVRVPVLAAMYATWLTGMHDKAKEFWSRAIHITRHRYGVGDPALTLNSYLVRMAGQKGRIDRMADLAQFSWCTLAWNAFIRGVSLVRFQLYSGKSIPAMIGMAPPVVERCKLFSSVYNGD